MADHMTIAVDLDGVLHAFTSGWHGVTVIEDPPVEGAIQWLNDVVEAGHKVIIHTSRFARPEDYPDGAKYHDGSGGIAVDIAHAIRMWLLNNGARGYTIGQLQFHMGYGKPHSHVYIDDRAWRFRGVFPSLDVLERYRYGWNQTSRGEHVVGAPEKVTITSRGEKVTVTLDEDTPRIALLECGSCDSPRWEPAGLGRVDGQAALAHFECVRCGEELHIGIDDDVNAWDELMGPLRTTNVDEGLKEAVEAVWRRNDQVTLDILAMVGDNFIKSERTPRFEITPTDEQNRQYDVWEERWRERLVQWSDEDIQATEAWAGAIHLSASDNEGVTMHEPPKVLARYLPDPIAPLFDDDEAEQNAWKAQFGLGSHDHIADDLHGDCTECGESSVHRMHWARCQGCGRPFDLACDYCDGDDDG